MRDYSKYIQSSYGFITSYKIEDGKIYVFTAQTEKNEPHIYPATSEWVKSIETRMERQYRMLIDNKDVIMKDYLKRVTKPVKTLFGLLIILCLIGGVTSSLYINALYPFISGAVSAMLFSFASFGFVQIKKIKMFDELNLIESYVDNKTDIENVNERDKNVTNHLLRYSNIRYEEKLEQKKQGLIEDVFNIDFMDRLSLVELKNLLNRYFICKGLESEQIFVSPVKSRTKKKSNIKDIRVNMDI